MSIIDQFERYVTLASSHEQRQLLLVAQIPAFRNALAVCIRNIEEEIIKLDPHQEGPDENLLKAYRQLYNERSLYQDFLNGISRLLKQAVEEGILPETSGNVEIGSIENVVASPREAFRQ